MAKKEVVKHFVLVNDKPVAEVINAEIAKILINGLEVALVNEKNVDIRHVKQTSEVDIPEPKPEEQPKKEEKKVKKEKN